MRKFIKIAAVMAIMSWAGLAQADLITHTIDFTGYTGANNGTGTDGPFTYTGLGTDNSGGNCPDNAIPLVAPRCARLNPNDMLTFVLTDGGEFDLIDFWWRSTGEQENSDLFLEWDDGGSNAFGFFNDGDNDTVYQLFNLDGITALTFSNRGTGSAVVRIDNITFRYDDGLCDGLSCEPCDDCEPVPVPEPGTLALLGLGLLGIAARRRKKV